MTDKLITIQYNPVVTNVTLNPVSANLTVVPVVAKSELYDANIRVVVRGAEESSIPTAGKYQRALSNFLTAQLLRKTVGRLTLSNTFIADSFATNTRFSRVFIESANFADQKTVLVNKNTRTQLTAKDLIPKFSSAVKADLVFSSSQTTKLTTLVKSSLVDSSDIRSLANLKIILNQFVSTDLLTRTVDYNKSLVDLVGITDDYYGLSNIDDDQYAYFDKRLLISLSVKDLLPPVLIVSKPVHESAKFSQIRKSLARVSKLEQFNLLDFSTRRIRKNNVEKVVDIDIVYKNYVKRALNLTRAGDTTPSKNLQKFSLETINQSLVLYKRTLQQFIDSTILSEIVLPALLMPKQYSDGFLASMQDSKLVSLIKADTSTIELTQFIATSILKVENLATQDSLISKTSFIRDFHNYLYATDDYYGLSNIDDDQIAFFNKQLLDLIRSTELYHTSTQTIKTSTANIISNFVAKDFTSTNTTLYSAEDSVSKSGSKSVLSAFTLSELIDILRGTFLFDTVTLVDPKSFELYSTQADFAVPGTTLAANTQTVRSSSTNSTLDLALFASNLALVNSISSIDDLIDVLRFTSYGVISPVSTTDTGYANNQNYFSEAYVEPGYVGTNSYFS